MEGPHRQKFRSRRVGLELPVDLTFPGSTRPVSGRSVNISETGILVRADVIHPPGTAVRFDIPPRYGGRGEVAWSRRAEDGSILMGLSLRRSRHALMDLLEDHLH